MICVSITNIIYLFKLLINCFFFSFSEFLLNLRRTTLEHKPPRLVVVVPLQQLLRPQQRQHHQEVPQQPRQQGGPRQKISNKLRRHQQRHLAVDLQTTLRINFMTWI